MRNPFSLKDPVTNNGYSVDERVSRIKTLVRLHRMTLINGDQWVVEMREGAPRTRSYPPGLAHWHEVATETWKQNQSVTPTPPGRSSTIIFG
jgi:hypothetical protein